MSSNNSIKDKDTNKLFAYHIYLYMYKTIWYQITHKGWYAIKDQPANH